MRPSKFRVGLSLLFLAMACTTTRPDPRADFVRSLPGVSVEDYRFTEHEDDERAVASLINPVLRNPIKLGRDDAHLVLGYAKTKDKKTGSTNIYKNEVVRSGNAFMLVVTAVPSGEIVLRQPFSPPAPHGLCDNEQKFDSLNDCLCVKKAPFQCEADRTCETLVPAILCCLKNGTAIDVHLIITPAFSRHCLLKGIIVDIGDLVFTE